MLVDWGQRQIPHGPRIIPSPIPRRIHGPGSLIAALFDALAKAASSVVGRAADCVPERRGAGEGPRGEGEGARGGGEVVGWDVEGSQERGYGYKWKWLKWTVKLVKRGEGVEERS